MLIDTDAGDFAGIELIIPLDAVRNLPPPPHADGDSTNLAVSFMVTKNLAGYLNNATTQTWAYHWTHEFERTDDITLHFRNLAGVPADQLVTVSLFRCTRAANEKVTDFSNGDPVELAFPNKEEVCVEVWKDKMNV